MHQQIEKGKFQRFNNMNDLEIKFTFSTGEKSLWMQQLHKTYVHHFNDHKLRATVWSGPAPWLGNAFAGGHTSPYSFVQVYCKTCEEKHGVFYLDRFDEFTGIAKDEPLSLEEVQKEVREYINTPPLEPPLGGV